MSATARYIYIAIVIYMWLLIISSILGRVAPRPGTTVHTIHRALLTITEPYLMVIRRVAPKIERGTIDWSVVIGLTVLFVVVQVVRQF